MFCSAIDVTPSFPIQGNGFSMVVIHNPEETNGRCKVDNDGPNSLKEYEKVAEGKKKLWFHGKDSFGFSLYLDTCFGAGFKGPYKTEGKEP